MDNGTVQPLPTAGSATAQPKAPREQQRNRSAAEAAEILSDEFTRFGRLVAAWKHAAKERGTADRALLARLVLGGERRATDLATEAMLDLSTVSRQVRALVENGLVERRPDPEDRRGALLAATPSGREAFAEYRDERNADLAGLLADWSAADRYELCRLFGRLNDTLTEQYARRCAGPGTKSPAAAEQGDAHA